MSGTIKMVDFLDVWNN